MKKDKGTQFLCKDCEKYSLCEYYHCRKEDSYICKYFHLPNKLDKIRAEIMDFEEELFHRPNTDYTDYAAVRHCVEIIDKYKAESEDKE